MNFKIRYANLEDYSQIENILIYIHNIHHEKNPKHFKKIDFFMTFDEFNSFITNEKNKIFIAEYQNKLIGICKIKIIDIAENNLIYSRKSLLIENFGVLEKYQNMGVGKSLLKQIETFSNSLKINHIQLQVWGFNTNAINFYKNENFIERTLILNKYLI